MRKLILCFNLLTLAIFLKKYMIKKCIHKIFIFSIVFICSTLWNQAILCTEMEILPLTVSKNDAIDKHSKELQNTAKKRFSFSTQRDNKTQRDNNQRNISSHAANDIIKKTNSKTQNKKDFHTPFTPLAYCSKQFANLPEKGDYHFAIIKDDETHYTQISVLLPSALLSPQSLCGYLWQHPSNIPAKEVKKAELYVPPMENRSDYAIYTFCYYRDDKKVDINVFHKNYTKPINYTIDGRFIKTKLNLHNKTYQDSLYKSIYDNKKEFNDSTAELGKNYFKKNDGNFDIQICDVKCQHKNNILTAYIIFKISLFAYITNTQNEYFSDRDQPFYACATITLDPSEDINEDNTTQQNTELLIKNSTIEYFYAFLDNQKTFYSDPLFFSVDNSEQWLDGNSLTVLTKEKNYEKNDLRYLFFDINYFETTKSYMITLQNNYDTELTNGSNENKFLLIDGNQNKQEPLLIENSEENSRAIIVSNQKTDIPYNTHYNYMATETLQDFLFHIKNSKYNTVQIDNVTAFVEKLVRMIQDLETTTIFLKNIVTSSEQKIIGLEKKIIYLQKNDNNQDTHIRQNDENIKQLIKQEQEAEETTNTNFKIHSEAIKANKTDIDTELSEKIHSLQQYIDFSNKCVFAAGGTFFVGAIAVIVYLLFKINCLEKALLIQNQKY